MLKLIGHKNDVRAVAFTPDGRIVSGGGDKTVRVWDPISGECVTMIKAGQVIYAVAVSPDGKTMACAGRPAPRTASNFVQVFDTAGKLVVRYEVRTFGRVWRYDGATGLSQSDLQPMARTIWSLAYSADGRYLAAAVRRPGGANMPDGDGGFYWQLGASSEHSPLLGEDIYALAFAPVGHRLAVTRNRSIVFLERPDADEGVKYSFSASWSPAVVFVPGVDLAVLASNSFIEFLNPTRHLKPTRVKSGSRTIIALAASPDGKTLLAGGRPGSVEVYDVATRAKRATYDFGIGGVHSLAYAPDGLTFAAAGDDGLIVCDSTE